MNHVAYKVGRFLDRTFKDVHREGPSISPEQIRKLSIMPVCTHRSQIDYFILGCFLHSIGVHRVRYAAGDNLTGLPILGARFQDCGAFPVSRSRVRNRAYVRSLCEQVVGMLAGGDSVVVFPEGGRSYLGRMMDMKSGLIGACVMAQWRNPEDEFAFFPVAISYERVPELSYFDMLRKGRDIRATNGNLLNRLRGNAYYFGADLLAFSKFMLASRTSAHYGTVYVDHGEPLAVRALVDLDALYDAGARDEFSALRRAMQKAGEHLHRHFLRLYRLLPSHVLSVVLQTTPETSRMSAVNRIGEIVSDLNAQDRNTKSLNCLTEQQILDHGTAQLTALKAIACKRDRLAVRRPTIIQYHAASVVRA
jgi:1-acyl-sn-glycerol-3-phosphate acyltransferase